MNKKLGFFALLIAAFVYSTFGILARQLSTSFGNFTQAMIRCLVAFFFISLWILFKKTSLALPKVNKVKLAVYIITPSLSIIAFTQSVTRIKAANTIFYIYAGFFIGSLILGKLFFKEKITVLKIGALLLSGAGLILLSHPLNVSLTSIGVFYGILAGLIDSLNSAMCKFLGSFNRSKLLFYQYFAGTVIGLLMVFLSQEKMVSVFTPLSAGAALMISLSQIVIGSLWLYGFNSFDLSLGTIVSSSELFFVLVLNALVLKEQPTLTEFIGGLLVFFAIVFINLSLDKRSTKSLGKLEVAS